MEREIECLRDTTIRINQGDYPIIKAVWLRPLPGELTDFVRNGPRDAILYIRYHKILAFVLTSFIEASQTYRQPTVGPIFLSNVPAILRMDRRIQQLAGYWAEHHVELVSAVLDNTPRREMIEGS